MKVIVSADGLTRGDYSRSGCDAVLGNCQRRWQSDYKIALGKHLQAVQEVGDASSVAVVSLVIAAMSQREPWSNAPLREENHSTFPTYEFAGSAFTYMKLLLGLDPVAQSVIADDEVKARVADILYQRSVSSGGRRDFRAAEIAVGSYLAEATRQGVEHWHKAEAHVSRAFAIAAELNSERLKKQTAHHVDTVLHHFSAMSDSPDLPSQPPTAPCLYQARLMQLLLRFGEGEPVRYAPLAERLAQEALGSRKWDIAREYLGITALWHEKARDYSSQVTTLERVAELWIQQGEDRVGHRDANPYQYAMAAQELLNGIQALRAVRGAARKRCLGNDYALRLDERIHEVRWLHQHYQERAAKAMVAISESDTFDPSEIFALVEGKDKMEALFAMTRFALPRRADVETAVQDDQGKYLMSRFFGLAQLDDRGRTTARADAGDLWAQTCQRAVTLYEIRAQCHIGPLLWKIEREHAVDLADFTLIARISPFVPAVREPLFARGLHEGFKGNFTLALHLLIPQVENSIRIILRDAVATDDGLREKYTDALSDPEQPSLNQSLYEPWASKLAEVLGEDGEDVVFALRALLVERFGANLRNGVLHGLLPNGGTQGWRCWYLWWLFMRICCSTALAVARQQDNEHNGSRSE